MDYVYVLVHSSPDLSSSLGPPKSVHESLYGAKKAFSEDGKYTDDWLNSTINPDRWTGPDGFGTILKLEVKP